MLTDPDQTLLFLITNKSIDRELIQSIDLELIASDNRPPLKSSSDSQIDTSRLAIRLQITDINDNIPRFVLNSGNNGDVSSRMGNSGSSDGGGHVISLEFDEGLPANSHLLTLKAHDPDADAQIRYELALNDGDDDGDSEIERTFRLDPVKGELFLRRKLELDAGRAAKNAWQLSVRARDVASGKYDLALVNLKLNDVNNHAPDVALTFFYVTRYLNVF